MSAGAIPALYRIIKSDPSEERDFYSAMMLARIPPRRPERKNPGEWAGISMFNSVEEARRRVAKYPQMGTAIAQVEGIDPVWSIVKPTGEDGHYTAWGRPGVFLLAVREILSVTDEG